MSARLDMVLEVLRRHRQEARDLGVELVGVIGSTARGDDRPDSDVDLVYEPRRPGHLWALLGLAARIEDELGRRVDLVDRDMAPPDRWSWMARDLVRL